jgi:hypothetical protein
LALIVFCLIGCSGEEAVPEQSGLPTTVSEIPGAPEYIWFEDYSDGFIGDPHREPGHGSLGWVLTRQTPVGAEYVECNPLVEGPGRIDNQITTQCAGYVLAGGQQSAGGKTWTRYRKVALTEALRRRNGGR